MPRPRTQPAQVSAVLTLLALLAQAGEPWQNKAAGEWTQEEATQVLTDSPWGHEARLLHSSGRMLLEAGSTAIVARDADGRMPLPPWAPLVALRPELLEAVYAVRWSSAAMVQAALARLKELSPVLADVQAAPPELSAEHYVLTVRVVQPPSQPPLARAWRTVAYTGDEMRPFVPSPPPLVADLFAHLSEAELRARAELRTAKKLRLKPDRVLRHGLGASEGISFFFPRLQDGRETLPAGTDGAEFVFANGGELKAKFKLKEMQVSGRPDY